MENDFLDTQIIFKADDNELYIGETREAKIIFSPLKDIAVHRIGYQLVMEGRGRTDTIKKNPVQKTLIQHQTLFAGETYEFDISIEGVLPGSYKGQNIEFNWRVETFIELAENSYSEIRNALIKGFKLFKAFNPNKVLAEEKDIFIYQEPQPYKVIPVKSALSYYWGYFGFFLVIGIILGVIFIGNFSLDVIPIWGYFIFGILITLIIGISFYKKFIIEKIIYEIGNLEDNQFMVLLDLSNNWKSINQIQCSYHIIEKVVDNRGTSSSTHQANIFKSKTKKEIRPKRNQNFIFNFPEKNLPASFQEGDVSFIWEIEIKATLILGMVSISKEVITVSKIK